MSIDVQDIARKIKPYVLAWIGEATSTGGGGSGYAPAPHDLGSSYHSGTLLDSQGPNFLLRDGSRSILGNLAVASGITVDGVDIDVFKASYDSHVLNPDAHHLSFIGLRDDSATAYAPTAGYMTIAGGAGIASAGSGSTLTLNLETPATLSVSSANTVGTGHSHAITSSSAPGAAASLLATNASGQLTLAGTLTLLATSALVVRQSGDTQPRIQLANTGALSFGSGAAAGDTVLRRTAANQLTIDNGSGGAVATIITGDLNVGRTTDGPALANLTSTALTQLRLEYDSGNYADLGVGAGGNLTLAPTGDVIFDPVGNDILPQTSYDLNIGAINRKYLTLHAAELWVETLVAQNTIATIGGRILVGPTTVLATDLATATRTYTSPTFRAAGSGSQVAGSSTITVSYPPGTVAGDVVVVAILYDFGASLTITPPTGWSFVRQTPNGTNSETVIIYYRRIEPTDDLGTSPVFGISSPVAVSWGTVALIGVWPSLVVHANSGQANTSSTSVASAGLTTLYDNSFVLFFGGVQGATSLTPPAGYSELLDVAGVNTLQVSGVVRATAGATGTVTGTAAAAGPNVGCLVAFSPTPTATGTIQVKHNQMSVGDIVYMEANGSVEFMRVTSGPTGTGPYSYGVARDLDGTGTNAWNAGDAVFNTGQAGNGFIDLYSLAGIYGQALDYVFNFNNSGGSPYETGSWSQNYNLNRNWELFGDGANTAVGDAMYFGVAGTGWNNLYFNVSQAWAGTATFTWEYWNGSSWTAFTPTLKIGGTVTGSALFSALGQWGVEWTAAALQNWQARTLNGVSAWWVRVRISAFTSWTTPPIQSRQWLYWRARNAGPAITMNVRNSTTFNDWTEYAALGNLNGLYDYGADVYGFAAGRFGTTGPWISADAANGFRVMRGTTKLAQWDVSGNITVGQVAPSQSNVFITAGEVRLRNNTTNVISLRSTAAGDGTIASFDGAIGIGTSGGLYQGSGSFASPTTGIKLWNSGGVGKLSSFNGGTQQVTIDTDGKLKAGAGNVVLDASGIAINTFSGSGYSASNALRFTYAKLYEFVSFGGGYATTETRLDVPPGVDSVSSIVLGGYNRFTGNRANLTVDGETVYVSGTSNNVALLADRLIASDYPVYTKYAMALGSISQNYVPNASNWLNGGTSLLFNSETTSSIGFHDAGDAAHFITVGGGVMVFGHNGGWGHANVQIPGYCGIGYQGNSTTASLVARGKTNDSSQNAFAVQQVSGTNLLIVRNDGAYNFINSAWTTSDRRWKANIMPLEVSDDDYLRLQPVAYQRVDRGTGEVLPMRSYGLIAQDVQAVRAEVVHPEIENEDYLTLDYQALDTMTMVVVQRLIREVRDLRAQITRSA